MGAEVTGMDSIEEGIRKQIKQFASREDEMLKAGAKVVEPVLKQHLPSGGTSTSSGTAQESLTVSGVVTENGQKAVKTGWPQDVAWRIHFIERGTMYQPAQAPIQKTVNATRMAVFAAMLKEGKRSF